MQVTINNQSNDILNKLYTAARTCYSSEDPDTIYKESFNKPKEELLKTIEHTLKSTHYSVIEHHSITFFIKGISRACAQQFLRHRLASPSMQSQRYCKLNQNEQFDYVVPNLILNNKEAKRRYEIFMSEAQILYNYLTQLGIPAEDARYVLPNATATNITFTANLRQLIHICAERTCLTAQSEIRQLVSLMRAEVIKVLPFMEKYLQPKCEHLGFCPESKKRSCGRKPTKALDKSK